MESDIFISYAREDINFVRKLNSAIDSIGKQTWVDWEGIPPTSEWMVEIYGAIESANAFVFVISPDAISSEICLQELAYAVENNKRLIPLVRSEVNDHKVAKELSQLNWIFFRKEDDFHVSLQLLVTAIDTDYDWVRAHTRLLVRAKEWDTGEFDKSLLMRGKELQEAESWLASSAQKEPTPTGLHSQYIVASRKQTTKRLTTSLLGVAVALVAVTILAVVAIYQKRVSEQRRELSLARSLTTQSVLLRQYQFDVSLLLGQEANRIVERLKKSGTGYITVSDRDVKGVLLDGLAASPKLVKYLRGHSTTISSIAYSPDGKILASGDNDGTIILWNMDSMRVIGRPLKNVGTRITSVTFSPAGDLLAVALCREPHPKYGGVCRAEIQLLNHTTGEFIGPPFTGHKWNVTDIDFSSDGTLLASAGGWEDNSIIVWDLKSRKPVGAPLLRHTKAVTSIDFSQDNSLIASSGLDGNVLLWDLRTQTSLVLDSKKVPVWRVSFSPDGLTLAGGDSGGAITLWDVTGQKVIGTPILGHGGEARDLVFVPDGKTLVSVGRDNAVVRWAITGSTAIPTTQIGHTQDILSVDVSPDNQLIATAGVGGELIIWRTNESHPLGRPLLGHNASVESLAFEPTSNLLASGDASGNVFLWNSDHPYPQGEKLAKLEGPILDLAFNFHGTKLVSMDGTGLVTIWDPLTGKTLGKQSGVEREAVSIAKIGRDADVVVYATKSNNIKTLNIKSDGNPRTSLTGHDNTIESLALSSDNKHLVSAGKDGFVLWDLEKSLLLRSIAPRLGGSIFDTEFTPQGKKFVSAQFGGLQLWDVLDGEPEGELLDEHGILVSRMAFAPDGEWFASGSLYKRGNIQPTVQLWDPETYQPVGAPLKQHSKSIKSLAFSPNGKILASGGEDNTIVLWDVDLVSWNQRACEIINRSLTIEEWKYYLGDEPYHETCSQ